MVSHIEESNTKISPPKNNPKRFTHEFRILKGSWFIDLKKKKKVYKLEIYTTITPSLKSESFNNR